MSRPGGLRLNVRERARHRRALADAQKWLDAEVERLNKVFEEKPDRWQESRAGQKVEDWIGELEESVACIEEALEQL